jgi:6-phosphogluconolactonase
MICSKACSGHELSKHAVCAQVAIPREQVYAIQEGLPVHEAATEYAGQLLRLGTSTLPRNEAGKHALELTHPQAGCAAEAAG